VLAEVHALGERAHLVVAGDGPLRRELERDAARRGLTPYVHLLGARRDVEYIIGGIDVLVLTSGAEGVPGVLIEALMVGCPVVTVRVGGVSTIVEDGKTGFVVDTASPAAMAERVLRLLRDAELRTKFSVAGRRRSSEFSSRSTALMYAARFEALLGGTEDDGAPD